MSNQLAIFIDFENVALWAEREFIDFELTPLMEYLQIRGPAVVKRAYGDWSRFSRYRDELMNHAIDLIQIYSVRAGKNRTDIRMAIDALEIAMYRPQISTFVVVSGDSDFGPLVTKLREYGKYTIGIGPRNITHHLLVKSCDEFVYLETIMGDVIGATDQTVIDRDSAQTLLKKALQVHAQRGELPIQVTQLKQTMLMMDPAFNEANFGYAQFKSWLEDSPELVKLFNKDTQLYVAPFDFQAPDYAEVLAAPPLAADAQEPAVQQPGLESQYRQVFTRLKLTAVDLETRRDVLRDIYREVCEHPGEHNLDELLDLLEERYEEQGVLRNKATLIEIVQMAMRRHAFDYGGQPASMFAAVGLEEHIDSEAEFISAAEADYLYAIIRAGLELDLGELAVILLNDRTETDYLQCLLDEMQASSVIARRGRRYYLPTEDAIPFRDEPALQVLCRDIDGVRIPENLPREAETARTLAKKAMLQRSQDFVASAETSLLACRLQWDALEKNEPGASLEDLRYYMASYASVVAGKLSQVNRDYAAARPYYLAFFALVQEEDPLWTRMRGLINPMLSYYWGNTGRELELNTSTWNLSGVSPAQVAIQIANHPDPELRQLWYDITVDLAKVNPGLLKRIANQIALSRSDWPENMKAAQQIDGILSNGATD